MSVMIKYGYNNRCNNPVYRAHKGTLYTTEYSTSGGGNWYPGDWCARLENGWLDREILSEKGHWNWDLNEK